MALRLEDFGFWLLLICASLGLGEILVRGVLLDRGPTRLLVWFVVGAGVGLIIECIGSALR